MEYADGYSDAHESNPFRNLDLDLDLDGAVRRETRPFECDEPALLAPMDGTTACRELLEHLRRLPIAPATLL